jgi:wyosine [tRNA(Phe)-imidazoG37] synthetase (radical SAM superfamily)
MLLSLQKGIAYGPIRSRRLGHSLGINLLPSDIKVCTFNCLYCQYGWTDYGPLASPGQIDFPSRRQVAEAIEKALKEAASPPDYITFSGNGEPTIHPDFPGIVDDVIEIRNRLAPAARTAVLSNSTTVTDPRIRQALSRLDMRIMKLDAGSEERLAAYNQPASGYCLNAIVKGLAALKDVTLQALFTAGSAGNSSEQDVAAWIEQVRAIRPAAVQIYTLDRGYPSGDIGPLERNKLEAIGERLRAAGVRVEVF